jgi:hypothetical protein
MATRTPPKFCNTLQSCEAHSRCKIHCVHTGKLCCTADFTVHMRPSCATRSKVVQHVANAKFTVQTWRSCDTRCMLLQSCATRGQCEIYCAHTARLCNTPPMQNSCAHAAKLCYTLHAAKLCNTRPMRNTFCAHAAKLCNTRPSCGTCCRFKFSVHMRPSCAARCKGSCATRGQVVQQAAAALIQIQCAHAAKLCSTLHRQLCNMRPSCATSCGGADAKFTVHTRPSCAARCTSIKRILG